MLDVSDALRCIVEHVAPLPAQAVPVEESLGRVLAEEIRSPVDSPPFDKSMMDGFAVRAEEFTRTREAPVRGEILAGDSRQHPLESGAAARIMTGAPIPQGADAVVQLEHLVEDAAVGRIRLQHERPIAPGLNIVPRGQNLRAGEPVFAAGRRIGAPEIALLAEMGIAAPLSRGGLRVAILATGDELIGPDQPLGPGQIRNSNAPMLAAQVLQTGATPVTLGIAGDNVADLTEKIRLGLESEFLCLSGGVSAGKVDLVPQVLASLGVRALFHKIRLKPGKPLLFGIREETSSSRRCVVFGLPGNPVSSLVCFELFVRTALHRALGVDPAIPVSVPAFLQTPFSHRSDRPTWFPARLSARDGQLVARPLDWRGSSDLKSVAEANCSLELPEGEVQLNIGDIVRVLPWGNFRFA